MFARRALRCVGRPSSHFRPILPAKSLVPRATFKNSSKKSDPETVQESQVPVISYQGGERITEELHIGATTSAPVSPPGGDAESVATPLSPGAYKHMTPTLRKFTLPDKVAVVTG